MQSVVIKAIVHIVIFMVRIKKATNMTVTLIEAAIHVAHLFFDVVFAYGDVVA